MNYILAHFIGDFLLQNDWQAVNKKKSSLICTLHVTLYILPFLFCGLTVLQIFLIYIQHWLQDRTKFVSWYCRSFRIFQGELKQNVLPWGHFVVDQIFHFIWMVFVVHYLYVIV